jgi:hypothetical protein
MMATAANAASVSYDATVADKQTDWAEVLSLPKFNPALGTLTKVTLTLFGRVDGTVQVENLNEDNPATTTLTLAAKIIAEVAGATLEVEVNPFDNTVVNLDPYDGTIDWMGPSGATFESFATDEKDESTMIDLAQFIGPGNINVNVSADGTSSHSGTGNLAFIFRSTAQAKTTVTYTYSEIPLPAGLPLLATAVGGLVLLRRRKAA